MIYVKQYMFFLEEKIAFFINFLCNRISKTVGKKLFSLLFTLNKNSRRFGKNFAS